MTSAIFSDVGGKGEENADELLLLLVFVGSFIEDIGGIGFEEVEWGGEGRLGQPVEMTNSYFHMLHIHDE